MKKSMLVLLLIFTFFLSGCVSGFSIMTNDLEYETAEISGVYGLTEEIKSLNVKSDINSNLAGFKIGVLGSLEGKSGTITNYYVYVNEEEGKVLRKYDAEKTYINETSETPSVEETYKFITINEDIMKALYESSEFFFLLGMNKRVINGHIVMFDDDFNYLNVDEAIYERKDKSKLNQNQKEKLLKHFPNLLDENRMLFAMKTSKHKLNVPEGTIIEEYKIN